MRNLSICFGTFSLEEKNIYKDFEISPFIIAYPY